MKTINSPHVYKTLHEEENSYHKRFHGPPTATLTPNSLIENRLDNNP